MMGRGIFVAALAAAFMAFAPTALAAQNGKIAFVHGNNADDATIYTVNPDGSGKQALVQGRHPTWSPSGKALLFQRGEVHLGTDSIWVWNGTTEWRIASGRWPTWSPNGHSLAYESGPVNAPVIRITTSTGGEGTIVAEGSQPSWSPRGDAIAYTDREARLMAIHPGTLEKRVIHPFASEADWSPDGSQLVAICGYYDVCVMKSDGTVVRQITMSGKGIGRPTWSPDGTQILVSIFRYHSPPTCPFCGDYDIYAFPAAGGEGRNVTDTNDLHEVGPDWQPTGGPTPVTPPTISGAPQEGQTLTASPGTWDGEQPITYRYMWSRCANGTCSGTLSTATTYRLTAADVGHRIHLSVIAANDMGSYGASAEPTAVVSAAPTGDRRQRGTRGNDTLTGTAGDDWLFGGEGLDRLLGLAGDDVLWGGGDADTLDGGAGGDRLEGGEGGDALSGGGGNDDLRGGPGNDAIDAGAGSDVAWGGGGDDTIDVRDGEVDRVFCGSGRDTVQADAADQVHRDCEVVTRS